LLPSSKNCPVQTAFVKTSISVPSDMLAWVKSRALEEGNLPVSRIITQAIREKMARESKPKKGGVRK
jgi:metal-responsive CopG/Arc/MetJ family transcriptional regulator